MLKAHQELQTLHSDGRKQLWLRTMSNKGLAEKRNLYWRLGNNGGGNDGPPITPQTDHHGAEPRGRNCELLPGEILSGLGP